MIHENLQSLRQSLRSDGVAIEAGSVKVTDPAALRERGIDDLIWTAVFSGNEETRNAARGVIHEAARQVGAVPASIQGLYEAIGRGEVSKKFTVPAHNIRTLTYDMARRLFRAAIELESGAFIFEIARSEMGYTDQRPAEYAACILAAAVKEGYKGAVFIQGDHFQASAKRWNNAEREKEQSAIEALIDDAIAAEFYNIDIDTSTLVDLSFPTLDEQQRANYEGCAHFTKHIREREPQGIAVSVGGEIGEVGKHNTNPDEFRAYINGYQKLLPKGMKGISKVSIQTGTSHGGVVNPDGTIAEAKIDFPTIKTISGIARKEYGIGGAVQHGASTLSDEVFHTFPESDTLEIHLATAFQSMVYDHPKFPTAMKAEVAEWCTKNAADERKSSDTDEQFVYKARKKALGPFKKRLWELEPKVKDAILDDLQAKFAYLMKKLSVDGSKEFVEKYVPVKAGTPRPVMRGAAKAAQPLSALVVEGEGE
jgi:hypothetical protein